MAVIPAIQEAQVGESRFEASPRAKAEYYLKNKLKLKGLGLCFKWWREGPSTIKKIKNCCIRVFGLSRIPYLH
jgi:hypothetical protein